MASFMSRQAALAHLESIIVYPPGVARPADTESSDEDAEGELESDQKVAENRHPPLLNGH